jgi:hypothetical protein
VAGNGASPEERHKRRENQRKRNRKKDDSHGRKS